MPFDYKQFMKKLKHLVESGKVPMDRINDAVERILRVKFVAGLFEHPFSDRSLLDTVGCKVNTQSFILWIHFIFLLMVPPYVIKYLTMVSDWYIHLLILCTKTMFSDVLN